MLNINRKVILGSGSPRRRELLGLMGVEFEVLKGDLDEIIDETLTPKEVVRSLAMQKSEEIVKKIPDEAILITADTIVSYKGKLLGKPKDENDAFDMLKKMQGDVNSVATGVVIYDKKTKQKFEIVDETLVYMKEMTDEEIWAYIRTGDPMDKAGAYGVQTCGAVHVEKIEGDFYTVMGFPVNKVYDVLKTI